MAGYTSLMLGESAPDRVRGSVLAIGNFDGVHKGHAALLGQVTALAAAQARPACVLTFDPHPRRFFNRAEAPFALSAPADKTQDILACGIDHVLVLPFDAALAGLSAEAFIQEILIGQLQVAHVLVGQGFLFGHKRGGNTQTLQKFATDGAFDVSIIVAQADPETGQIYSSSQVRSALQAGDTARASDLLGRNWHISGRVVHGQQRGRELGFPTANIALGDYLAPRYGVYAVRVAIDGKTFAGVANFGVRPTVDGTHEVLEVHLFDYTGDLYGQTVQVNFIDFIRPEQRFANLTELKDQISRDCVQARAFFSSAAG